MGVCVGAEGTFRAMTVRVTTGHLAALVPDRAQCILLIRKVQLGVRSYSNLYGLEPGSLAPNLQSHVIGLGRFVEQTPQCPGNGEYGYGREYGNDTIPPIGALYMDCSLGDSDDHRPENTSDW